MAGSARVVAFDQFAYMGGGQRMLLESIAALLSHDYAVTLVAPKGGVLEAAIQTGFGASVRHLDCKAPELTHGKKGLRDGFRYIGQLLHFVKAYQATALDANVIYVNGPRWFLGGAILSRLTGRPVIFHLHLEHKGIQVKILQACARISKRAAFISNSNYIARKTYRQLGMLPATKFKVVENCLSSNFSTLEFEDKFVTASGSLQVVVLGILRPEKGQDLAVELARRCPEIVMHLVGRIGSGAEKWADAILRNAPSNVIFHGELLDIPRFLSDQGIQVNLVPSMWDEPFGLVAIEGMAGSCITVVSDKGALGDIARNTGAYVFDGGINDLVRIFGNFQRLSAQELTNMAKSQHTCVMREYSTERYRESFIAAFEDVLQ